jgi:hypothetical protein
MKHEVQQSTRCPDCNSIVAITEVAPQVFKGLVQHDDTCVWFADFQRAGGHGIRLIGSGD